MPTGSTPPLKPGVVHSRKMRWAKSAARYASTPKNTVFLQRKYILYPIMEIRVTLQNGKQVCKIIMNRFAFQ
jgi:hypothetical protein